MDDIVIKETTLEDALKVFPKIKEFDRKEAGTVEYCNQRLGNLDRIIIAAYRNNVNVGYLIGYNKGYSFYCWVAAADKNYRRRGILTKMMKLFEDYARENNYSKITLKTMNNKREMLSYLVKNNWNFIEVTPKETVMDNEIYVEKDI